MRKRKFFLPLCPAAKSRPQFGPDKPWLAPMAGYSDLPFRLLCREYGASVCVTEMISAKGLLHESPGTGELLQSVEEDQPLIVQLFGGEPESMGAATRILLQAGYAWFDCNLGCPARKVLRQNSGAKLLTDSGLVLEIAKAMLKAVKEVYPDSANGGLGFKLRLGLSPKKPAEADLPLRLEDAGASWLTLHPRFASQGYGGEADWQAITRLRKRLSIPLLASGDLMRAEDGIKCLGQTGAAGLMYARGALRNPFIFRQHRALLLGGEAPRLTHVLLKEVIERHVALSRDYRQNTRSIFKMRSIIPRYVRDLPGVHNLRLALGECEDWEQLSGILASFMDRSQPVAEGDKS